MPSERGVLLRRAVVTALLAGGVGAGAATVAIAATHGTPSASTSTTATTPSTAPSAKPTHNCPNMGSHAQGGSSASGFYAGPGQ